MLALRTGFPVRSNLFKVFDDFFSPDYRLTQSGYGNCAFDVDIKETEDAYVVKAEIPGINKEDISIELENDLLSIEFTKQEEKEEKTGNYCLQERCWGKHSRTFNLPSDVDNNSVDAVLKDGILTLSVNKAEQSKRKKIEVKVE